MIQITQIPDGFICNGEIWNSLDSCIAWQHRFWPNSSVNVETCNDEHTVAFWKECIKTGINIRT